VDFSVALKSGIGRWTLNDTRLKMGPDICTVQATASEFGAFMTRC